MLPTQIADRLIDATGQPLNGAELLISWPQFVASDGTNVEPGQTRTPINNGFVELALMPCTGATPTWAQYAVTIVCDGRSDDSAIWVVPVSALPVTIGAIRQPLPSTAAPPGIGGIIPGIE